MPAAPTRARTIFLHIPKAAGTTFIQVLERQFPRGTVLARHALGPDGLEGRIADLPQTARRGIRCVHGHFFHGAHTALPGPSRYLTMLREPVDRHVSSYYFALQNPDAPRNRWVRERPTDLDGYLGVLADEGRLNRQTHLIAGPPHPDGPADPLARARLHLERDFDLVGLTERFDETLLLAWRRLGWRHILYRRVNVTRSRAALSTLSPAQRAAIERANALDIELYDFARRRFAAAIADAGIGATELRLYRIMNDLYSRVRGGLGQVKRRLLPTP